ncbi:MAG: glycosyltransferase family 1 protein [Candidatus Uhrbacteria bacterium]
MRIAVDCRTILNPGYGEAAGVGHYTTAILRALFEIDQENQYILFFDGNIVEASVDQLIAGRDNVKIRSFPLHALQKFLPIIYNQMFVARVIDQEKPDVFFSPSGLLPAMYKGKSVITVHDLAIFRHPEWFPETKIGRHYSTKFRVPSSLRHANAIITPSFATANDVKLFFKFAFSKVEVIPHGVFSRDRMDFILSSEDRERFEINKKYFLSLCTIEPRKNIEVALRAFDRLLFKSPELAKQFQFVIAGKKGWKYKSVFSAIDEINQRWQNTAHDDVIRYLGYVTRNDKWRLLVGAQAFIYPSLYEGFGLPVLEAMSVGTPVVTSRLTSLPEVGGDAVAYIDPYDAGPMVTVLDRMCDDQVAQELGQRGLARSGEFTWEKSAQKTLEVLSRVGRGDRHP